MISTIAMIFILLSGLFIWVTAPLHLSFLLILMAVSLSGAFMLMGSKWLGISLILVYLGGMMVVFLYVSGVALHNKLTFSYSAFYFMACFAGMVGSLTMSLPLQSPSIGQEGAVSLLYYSYSMAALSLMISMLIFVLLFVVSAAESFKGAISKSW